MEGKIGQRSLESREAGGGKKSLVEVRGAGTERVMRVISFSLCVGEGQP